MRLAEDITGFESDAPVVRDWFAWRTWRGCASLFFWHSHERHCGYRQLGRPCRYKIATAMSS